MHTHPTKRSSDLLFSQAPKPGATQVARTFDLMLFPPVPPVSNDPRSPSLPFPSAFTSSSFSVLSPHTIPASVRVIPRSCMPSRCTKDTPL